MRGEINKYRQNCLMDRGQMEESLREELILKYAPLVKFIAERIAIRLPPNIAAEELVSAGIIGLFDALDKFDSDMGTKFETYAEHRIRGAILDELRRLDWVPRSVRKDIQRIEEGMNRARSRIGREPQDFEVAREMGIDLDAYYKIICRSQGVGLLSLDDSVSEKSSSSLAGQPSGDPSPLEELRAKEIKKILAEALSTLTKKEQLVMSLYYYDELTLKEIAKVLGLTESRICQIHSKAVIRLRSKLRTHYER